MATLTTSWESYASSSWTASGGSKVTFYLEARYISQSVANNTSIVQTRLRSTITGSIRGTGYEFTCTYCDTRSGTGIWTFENEVIISSGDKTITHNTDGTKSLSLSATAKNTYWNINKSMSVTVSLPKIDRLATINTATDFNDEGNPTITFDNPAGFTVKPYINFYDSNDNRVYQLYRNISATTPYTWEITSEERSAMRSAMTSQATYRAQMGVDTYNGSTSVGYNSVARQFTFINANPTQSITYTETNAKVISVLNNDTSATYIIKNASSLIVTSTPTALKSATISKVTLKQGTDNPREITTSPYTFTNVNMTSNKFDVIVKDSRGLENTYTKTYSDNYYIDYEPIDITIVNFERYAPTSDDIVLNAEIKYIQATFGSTANVPTIKWKKGESGTENTISSSDYTIDTANDKITITNLTLTNALSYQDEERLYLIVEDLLTEDSDGNVVGKGIPTFDAGEHDLQINGDFYLADTNRDNIVDGGTIIRARNEIITIGLPSDVTISPTSNYQTTKINLSSQLVKNGDNLILQNGAIKIGDGITKIKVSATATLRDSVETTGIVIYQNNSEKYQTYIYPGYVALVSCSLCDAMLDVQKNDVISLRVYTTSTQETRTVKAYSGYGTYLTVEAIY